MADTNGPAFNTLEQQLAANCAGLIEAERQGDEQAVKEWRIKAEQIRQMMSKMTKAAPLLIALLLPTAVQAQCGLFGGGRRMCGPCAPPVAHCHPVATPVHTVVRTVAQPVCPKDIKGCASCNCTGVFGEQRCTVGECNCRCHLHSEGNGTAAGAAAGQQALAGPRRTYQDDPGIGGDYVQPYISPTCRARIYSVLNRQ